MLCKNESPFTIVLGHYVRTNFGEMDCGKEEGFKAAYVFLFFLLIGVMCVLAVARLRMSSKERPSPRSQCQGRIFPSLVCVYVCM